MNAIPLFLIASCVALNVTLAKAATLLTLPFYFDCVGTILAAALLSFRSTLTVAVLTSLTASIVVHPAFGAYVGTQLVIAISAFGAVRAGWLNRWWSALLTGEVIGILAAVVSAPVTAIVFGGVVLSGTTAINAVLLASGHTLWHSVLAGALVTETIDKPTAAVVAWLVLQRLPRDMRVRLGNPAERLIR